MYVHSVFGSSDASASSVFIFSATTAECCTVVMKISIPSSGLNPKIVMMQFVKLVVFVIAIVQKSDCLCKRFIYNQNNCNWKSCNRKLIQNLQCSSTSSDWSKDITKAENTKIQLTQFKGGNTGDIRYLYCVCNIFLLRFVRCDNIRRFFERDNCNCSYRSRGYHYVRFCRTCINYHQQSSTNPIPVFCNAIVLGRVLMVLSTGFQIISRDRNK
jgi:hypothetical protein